MARVGKWALNTYIICAKSRHVRRWTDRQGAKRSTWRLLHSISRTAE